MKYIFLNQLFIVIKRKPFKFYYLLKYKIIRGHIWIRSGRAFHYWSGARQITLSGPIFPDRRPTKISARGEVSRAEIA